MLSLPNSEWDRVGHIYYEAPNQINKMIDILINIYIYDTKKTNHMIN